MGVGSSWWGVPDRASMRRDVVHTATQEQGPCRATSVARGARANTLQPSRRTDAGRTLPKGTVRLTICLPGGDRARSLLNNSRTPCRPGG